MLQDERLMIDWTPLVRGAVDKAIETHRRLGQSIVIMRDGKITWLAPEEIPPLEENAPSAIGNRNSAIE